MAVKPPIIVGLYPDVPAFRGVPQLRRSPTAQQIRLLGFATAAIAGRLWHSSQTAPKWGVFNSANQPVVTPDSVLDFGYRNEYRVSDFPVQQGAFATYNKVANPFEIAVRMSKGKDLAARSNFLRQIDLAIATLDLYTIVTPENTYLNCNLLRYEVTRRGSQGAFFLTDVDLFFRQIQQVASQYSTTTQATQNARFPYARPPVNQGIVQPLGLPVSVATAGRVFPTGDTP